MEEKLQQIKKNFNKLKEIRVQLTNLLNIIDIKINKLKTKTKLFIDNNKNNLFTFGLDSYQFQNKLIEYEYDDMKRVYNIFNNRMYCEYYKLYKLVSCFVEDSMTINKNLELLKLGNIFPIYKDLEPLKIYSFDIIEDLHKTIILLLTDVCDYIQERENELVELKKEQKSTLHINNFLNTYEYNIISINHKGLLYISYLEFFHIIHTKNFNRFANRMKTIDEYINLDINLDDINETKQEVTQNIIEEKSKIYSEEHTKSTFNISSPKKESKDIKSLFKKNANKVMNGLKLLKTRNNTTTDNDNDNNSEISINSFDTNESQKDIMLLIKDNINDSSKKISPVNSSLELNKENININKEHINEIFNNLTNNCNEILNSNNRQINIPENNEIIPENNEIIPENNEIIIPESNEINIPENNEIIPENNEIIPENNEIIPENNEIIPENNEIIPENNEIIPENNEIIPENIINKDIDVNSE
jgi:hypothetical protein